MQSIFLLPGEMIAVDQQIVLKTILGSCIAVALFDKNSGIAGLNHFLLPASLYNQAADDLGRYGDTAIPLLLQQLLKLGARPDHLRARIIGGGAVVQDLQGEFQVGEANIEKAREILERSRILIIEELVGGTKGRHLTFDTSSFTVSVREISHARQR